MASQNLRTHLRLPQSLPPSCRDSLPRQIFEEMTIRRSAMGTDRLWNTQISISEAFMASEVENLMKLFKFSFGQRLLLNLGANSSRGKIGTFGRSKTTLERFFIRASSDKRLLVWKVFTKRVRRVKFECFCKFSKSFSGSRGRCCRDWQSWDLWLNIQTFVSRTLDNEGAFRNIYSRLVTYKSKIHFCKNQLIWNFSSLGIFVLGTFWFGTFRVVSYFLFSYVVKSKQ